MTIEQLESEALKLPQNERATLVRELLCIIPRTEAFGVTKIAQSWTKHVFMGDLSR